VKAGGFPRAFSFTQEGKTVVIGLALPGLEEMRLEWRDALTLQLLSSESIGKHGDIVSIAASPDGQKVVVGTDDGSIYLWDAVQRKLIPIIPDAGEKDALPQVAFSPDGKVFVSSNSQRKIRLWDAVSGQKLYELPGTGDYSSYLPGQAFSPDGSLLALASLSGWYDTVIQIWDPHTGQKVAEFVNLVDNPHGLAFSSDGTLLAVGSFDGTVHVLGISGQTAK
jgi:WD40 repeat protein